MRPQLVARGRGESVRHLVSPQCTGDDESSRRGRARTRPGRPAALESDERRPDQLVGQVLVERARRSPGSSADAPAAAPSGGAGSSPYQRCPRPAGCVSLRAGSRDRTGAAPSRSRPVPVAVAAATRKSTWSGPLDRPHQVAQEDEAPLEQTEHEQLAVGIRRGDLAPQLGHPALDRLCVVHDADQLGSAGLLARLSGR